MVEFYINNDKWIIEEKPIVIMKTRVDTLKINGQEVQIYREKSKINIKERISSAISKIRYRKI